MFPTISLPVNSRKETNPSLIDQSPVRNGLQSLFVPLPRLRPNEAGRVPRKDTHVSFLSSWGSRNSSQCLPHE